MKGKSFQALINSIDENFYDKVDSVDQLNKFITALIKKYCEELHLPNVTINYKKCIGFASYDFYYTINIDETFLRIFDKMAEEKNFYYVYTLLDSVVHELRHHAQFSEIKVENGILKNFIEITKADVVQSHLQKKYSYYLEPTELDARHYAFNVVKNNKLLRKYYERKDYADNEIQNAQSNPFDIVGFLKDPFVNAKAWPLALANLEKKVADIANNHHLIFVPGTDQKDTSFKTHYNNNKINFLIDKSIAPGFYEQSFAGFYPPDPMLYDERYALSKLPFSLEMKLEKEKNSFLDAKKESEKSSPQIDRLLKAGSEENLFEMFK